MWTTLLGIVMVASISVQTQPLDGDDDTALWQTQSWLRSFGLRYSIERLSRLYKLDLKDKAVSDRDLAFLQPLKRLYELDLTDTGVTGKGLHHVRDLPRLRVLRLRGTPLEDEWLGYIAAMTRLRHLELPDQIKAGRVKELKKLLPDCRIKHKSLVSRRRKSGKASPRWWGDWSFRIGAIVVFVLLMILITSIRARKREELGRRRQGAEAARQDPEPRVAQPPPSPPAPPPFRPLLYTPPDLPQKPTTDAAASTPPPAPPALVPPDLASLAANHGIGQDTPTPEPEPDAEPVPAETDAEPLAELIDALVGLGREDTDTLESWIQVDWRGRRVQGSGKVSSAMRVFGRDSDFGVEGGWKIRLDVAHPMASGLMTPGISLHLPAEAATAPPATFKQISFAGTVRAYQGLLRVILLEDGRIG